MLVKLIDRLKGIRTIDPVNIDKFNDSIAQKTSWGPLKKGGASFGTHKLVEVSQRRLEFKPTAFAVIFYLIFTVLGFSLLGFGLYNEFQTSFEFDNIMLLIVGSIFFVVGIILGYSGTKPIVFDREFGPYFAAFIFGFCLVLYNFSRLLLHPLWKVIHKQEALSTTNS